MHGWTGWSKSTPNLILWLLFSKGCLKMDLALCVCVCVCVLASQIIHQMMGPSALGHSGCFVTLTIIAETHLT